MSQTLKLSFKESADFITKIAREKCCLNGDLEDAMNLIRSIMIVESDDPDDPFPADRYVYDILNGRAKLTGILSSDPSESTIEFQRIPGKETSHDISDAMSKFKHAADDAEERLRIMTNRYLFILDHISEYMTRDELYEIEKCYQDEYEDDDPDGLQLVDKDSMAPHDIFYGDMIHDLRKNDPESDDMNPPDEISAILRNPSKAINDFIQHSREEDDDDEYGWLEPDGTYHPVEWGAHSKWAKQYLEEHYPFEKYMELYVKDPNAAELIHIYDGDVLMYRLNWVLIDSPHQGYGVHHCNPDRPMTKKQKEFLYDYYRKHKNYRAADELYADEDV